MGAFLSRRLEALDLRVVLLDGKVFQGHCLLIALGLDSQGNKPILGLREGSTENACVAQALLADLLARGLSSEQPLLFVIDGAKALRKAIREVFGDLALVQRCQPHKRRNLFDHLPKTLQASIDWALREAWDEPCAALAERRLTALARSLEYEHPGAAASLREGLEETLTVTRLGLSGALRRSLRTTNLIESLNSSIETYTRNVKRWRGGAMAQRWVSAKGLRRTRWARRDPAPDRFQWAAPRRYRLPPPRCLTSREMGPDQALFPAIDRPPQTLPQPIDNLLCTKVNLVRIACKVAGSEVKFPTVSMLIIMNPVVEPQPRRTPNPSHRVDA